MTIEKTSEKWYNIYAGYVSRRHVQIRPKTEKKAILMKINKAFVLASAAFLLLAGCGNVENNYSAETTRAAEETQLIQQQTLAVSIYDPNAADPDTAVETVTQVTNGTLKIAEEEETTRVFTGGDDNGAETSAVTQQTESTAVTFETQPQQNDYSHDQPMGNEVMMQSVDYYMTETQAQQTQPAVSQDASQQGGEGQGQTIDGGVTANGYKIETIDGVTKVGGIIIANKSYSLPQNYGSGLDPEAEKAFYEMQVAAANDGIWLTIVSGYRSYWYQDQLYWGYVYSRGQEESDRFSAKAGHSEHQTGLAMDLNSANRSFVGTPEAQWIEAHCAEYGFIIRYPDGKEEVTGFMYEPWHVRYLGKDLARAVTDSGLALEEYLGIDSQYKE